MAKNNLTPANVRTESSSNIAQNPEIITAKGYVKIRLTVIIIVGIFTFILILGGLYQQFTNPSQAKDLWVIIEPMIAAAIAGLLGIEIGKRTRGE